MESGTEVGQAEPGSLPIPDRTGRGALPRVVLAGIAGNVLEWYDFAVYGYFAAAIGAQFFPAADPTASLIAAFGVFAAGFLTRPLGAVLFGHVADRIGRRPALVASVAMMALPTFLIGLLPGYDRIGLWAPALLVGLRLLQGLSVGGEYGTSVVYAVEHAPPGRRGLIGSWIVSGAIVGILLGSAVGSTVNSALPAEAVAAWGWRIPFLSGILVGGIGLLLRRGMAGAEPAPRPDHADGPPIVAAFRTSWRGILQVVGLSAMNGAGFYLLFVYSVTYLHQILAMPTRQAFDINTASMVLLLAMMPLGGTLSDRVGRRPMLVISAAALALLAWPLFRLLHHHDTDGVLLGQLGFAVLLGAYLGTIPATLAEVFPSRVRCSAFSVAYNLSLAVFGGLSPMVVTYLIARTHDDMAPAMVVIGVSLLSLAAALSLPETSRAALR
jgi:MHS family proline/betaine transporter-like MFS transporter